MYVCSGKVENVLEWQKQAEIAIVAISVSFSAKSVAHHIGQIKIFQFIIAQHIGYRSQSHILSSLLLIDVSDASTDLRGQCFSYF